MAGVQAFREWAASLGCPPESIPSEEALKSLFKSPQRDILYMAMKRVRPIEKCKALQRHIILKEVEKLGGGNKQLMIPSGSGRAFLPKKLQIYLRIQDLKRKRLECESRLEEYRKDYDILSMDLKSKNIRIMKVKHKNEALKDKLDLLHLKCQSLKSAIADEETKKTQFLKYMPVKVIAENSSDEAADNAIEEAVKTLNSFYEFCNNNSDPQSLQLAKDDLWSNMRNLIYSLPNFLIFNSITRLKEQQLQHIVELNKKKFTDSNSRSLIEKEPMNPFDIELMKAKIDFLAFCTRHYKATKERDLTEQRFYKCCSLFYDEFEKKVCTLNANGNEEQISEIISDYFVDLNSMTFYKRQNEFIQQEIDKIRADIEHRGNQLKNHELLLGTINQTYIDISSTINSVQHDMMQLGQIKEKIMYYRNMLKHKLHYIQCQLASSSNEIVSSNYGNSQIKICITSPANTTDSFETGSENMLCSTKLEIGNLLETSLIPSSNTSLIMKRSFAFGGDINQSSMMADGHRNVLPSHSLEMTIFSEIPFENFNFADRDCAFYFAPNPLVIESRENSSILQLAPGTLLTPNGALQEVRNRITWADSITSHSSDLKLNLDFDLTMADVQCYKERKKRQRERITELLDKIELTAIGASRTLRKAEELYHFSLETPLRLYIPNTKMFNNRTYKEFESEFKTYYRMAMEADASME